MAVAFFDLDLTVLDVNSVSLWVRAERKGGRLTRKDLMRALWFRRCGVEPKKCNDAKNFSWPKNPAFELYMSSSGRIEDELEVKSFLLEVEDVDLTEAGLAQKLKAPKLTETFVKKLQMLADKYDLRGGASKGSAPAAGAKSSVAKGAAAKGAGAFVPHCARRWRGL